MELKEIIQSGLLELYALGMTSAEETTQVEEWIKLYPELTVELDEIQAGLENYAMAHAKVPDAAVKDSIMKEIGLIENSVSKPTINESINPVSAKNTLTGKEPASVYTINSYFKWAAAASFILLIGSLILTYSFYNKYQRSNNDLASAKQELARQQEVAKAMEQQISVVTDKNSLPVSLNGTPHAPNAAAKIFWMKNTGDVYVAPGALPQPREGMQYQLWAIVDGKPVDGGMITTDNGNTYHIQKMNSFGKAEAFAITLEKKGGSPTPNMKEMYVIATI